jgi:hypothetical protein
MSIFDVFQIVLYGLCGFTVGRYLAIRFGVLAGYLGFIVVFFLTMILWRSLIKFIFSRQEKKYNAPPLRRD